MATAKLAPAPVADGAPADESTLVSRAKEHPYVTGVGAAALGPWLGPSGAVAAYLANEAYNKLTERDVANQATAAEREQYDVSTKPRAELPAWAANPTEERTVGWAKPAWVPSAAQQSVETAGKEFPDEYWQLQGEKYREELQSAKLGAQAEHKRQSSLYDLAQGVEADKQEYVANERQAASRLASDQTNAQIRIQQARDQLSKYDKAPDATIAGAFKKAGGFEKATALIGYIMGGVSTAGFSAINHQPNANPFIEAFEREAKKVVDQFGQNRQAAKERVAGEEAGYDAITRAFGDQRAARQFVMAGVMDLYKARIEEIAAQFGIDKNRADYQALLAQIDSRAAEPYAAAARTVQETSQQSQKFVPAQPIKRTVPVSAVIDPGLAAEGEALSKELGRYGALDAAPPELQTRYADYVQRVKAVQGATQNIARQRIMGSQGEDLDKQLLEYHKQRQDMKLNQLDTVAQAVDRVDRLMATGRGTGILNRYANLVSQGAIAGDDAALHSFASQYLSQDPEVAQALADVAAEYTRAQTGTAQTKQEIGKVLSAMGTGDRKSVHQFAQLIKQRVRNGESQLAGAFDSRVPGIYHMRRQIIQDSEEPQPFEGLRMSQ